MPMIFDLRIRFYFVLVLIVPAVLLGLSLVLQAASGASTRKEPNDSASRRLPDWARAVFGTDALCSGCDFESRAFERLDARLKLARWPHHYEIQGVDRKRVDCHGAGESSWMMIKE